MRAANLVLILALAACQAAPGSPASGQPSIEVARAALRGGSPQIALQISAGILASEPGNNAALIVQGDALTILRQYDQAQQSYDVVLRRDPSSIEAKIGLARLSLGSDPAAAEALLLEVLQRDPRNTTALNDLGVARDLAGNHAGAQEAYRQALGIDPRFIAAQVNLALSIAMTGRGEEAVRMLRPLASDPAASPKLRDNLAAALAMAGRQDEAARILSATLTQEEVRQALQAYADAVTTSPMAARVNVPRSETAAPAAGQQK